MLLRKSWLTLTLDVFKYLRKADGGKLNKD